MKIYQTQCLPVNPDSVALAGRLLAQGEVVAFPTETVYGLGANAFDSRAVEAIFEAKGRPQDNPLIVHIAEESQLAPLVADVPENARRLIQRYWPGPLTIILRKSDRIPFEVTAGLDTVAVRMPSHPAAQDVIRAAGVPIAAPSANRSGLPSPTRAEHVLQDMQGRIPLILDGGACGFGVESTVVDLTGDVPVLLRPGAVTFEMLTQALGRVRIGGGVLASLGEGEVARSPGLKHKHYAPRFARVLVLEGADADIARHVARFTQEHGLCCAAVVKHALAALLPQHVRVWDAGADDAAYASALFDALRALDDGKTQIIFCQSVPASGMGLALMNRLLRAAAFQVEQVAPQGGTHDVSVG